MNNVEGVIIVKKNTVQISDSFCKRELVVQTDEKYPQKIPIEFTQDKCDLLDTVKLGDSVSVSVNLGGRLWSNPKTGEDKYFLSLHGWRIEKASTEQGNIKQGNIERAFQEQAINEMDEDDDLPF